MVHRTCATRTLWAYFYCGLLRRALIQRRRSRLSSGFRIRGLHRSKYRLRVICLTFSLMMSRHPSAISVLDGASVGFVESCGSADHEGSMLLLKPGEWIRARANVKLHKWPSKATSARFRGVFWLGKIRFTLIQEVVLPRVRVYIQTRLPLPHSVCLHPVRSEHPAN